jgi:DNA-binding MarR family transcriptional regulator
MTPSELAKALLRPNPNITKLLDALVKDGLISRREVPNNRRTVSVEITNAGMEYIRQCLQKAALLDKEIKSYLTDIEIEFLLSVTSKLRRQIQILANMRTQSIKK